MPNLQISWLLLLVGLQTVASLGQSPPGPRFEADGVLSYSNGNHVAPLAPGVLMLIRGSGLGPREYCPSVSLGSGQREEPSPLLPNPDMANLVIYAMGGLIYWPDNQSSAAVAAAVRSRGATDAALRFLEVKSRLTAADLEGIAERAISDIRSNTLLILRGAVTVLRGVVYDPKWQVKAGLRNRAGNALIEAADHVVASADMQTLYDFAGTLGGVKDDRARAILLSFLERRIALPSTISALSSKRVPEDLATLAHLAFVPLAGKDQELEIDILPEQLHSDYGDPALPYLETMLQSSVNSRVRMQCARLLIRLGRPSGFDFAAKAIEQDRSDRLGMRVYLQEQFRELRTADDATILVFAKARSNPI